MTLPKAVVVGHRTYRIVHLSKKEHDRRSIDGECVFARSKIKVLVTGQTPQQQANTLLHEIIHAGWHETMLGKKPHEEKVATCLANVLTQVIRDNPEVFDWIAEKARS